MPKFNMEEKAREVFSDLSEDQIQENLKWLKSVELDAEAGNPGANLYTSGSGEWELVQEATRIGRRRFYNLVQKENELLSAADVPLDNRRKQFIVLLEERIKAFSEVKSTERSDAIISLTPFFESLEMRNA